MAWRACGGVLVAFPNVCSWSFIRNFSPPRRPRDFGTLSGMPRHPRTTAASTSELEPATTTRRAYRLEDLPDETTPQPEPVGPIANVELVPPQEPPAPPATATPGIVEDVLRLTKELASKKETAIQELLRKQSEIRNQLALLGYDPEPEFLATTPKARTKAPRKAPATKRKPPKMPTTPGEKFCPICNTTGSHDGRAHRYQKKKKAFTADELKAYEGR